MPAARQHLTMCKFWTCAPAEKTTDAYWHCNFQDRCHFATVMHRNNLKCETDTVLRRKQTDAAAFSSCAYIPRMPLMAAATDGSGALVQTLGCWTGLTMQMAGCRTKIVIIKIIAQFKFNLDARFNNYRFFLFRICMHMGDVSIGVYFCIHAQIHLILWCNGWRNHHLKSKMMYNRMVKCSCSLTKGDKRS